MRFFSKEEIEEFVNEHNYDIRVSGNARWIDQKCTPDVLTIIADCIVNTDNLPDDEFFSSIDIWHSKYTVQNVESIFRKPSPDEDRARNEYDKFFQQPMELLAYAGVLIKEKRGNRNFYKIGNRELLDYISLRERNALTFLQVYITKVLLDSGIYDKFDAFFNNPTNDTFDSLKSDYEEFIIRYTPINGVTECRRIFTKVINPLAFLRNTEGTERGRMSKHKIKYDMLMYNRDNFRDIYSEKPKDMTRGEYYQLHSELQPNKNYSKYMSVKAKRIVREYNDLYFNGVTELQNDPNQLVEHATQIHHIFPEADFPEISAFIENLIALTPTQHYNYAHPNCNTQKINKEYQHLCLLAKADTILEDYAKHVEPIYSFDKFLYVLRAGLDNDKFFYIEDQDYDGLITEINLSYA